jgi:PST family polysaccharide transporter
VAVTTGLLFVTQERAPELLKVGMIGTTIGIVSILIGLPFGPVGVAASFALSCTFVRVPICFWLAGRKGPVTVADLFASVAPSVIAGCAVFAAVFAFRHLPLVQSASPIVALLLCACVTLAVTAICFGCIPRSRRALLSMRHLSRWFLSYR